MPWEMWQSNDAEPPPSVRPIWIGWGPNEPPPVVWPQTVRLFTVARCEGITWVQLEILIEQKRVGGFA